MMRSKFPKIVYLAFYNNNKKNQINSVSPKPDYKFGSSADNVYQ